MKEIDRLAYEVGYLKEAMRGFDNVKFQRDNLVSLCPTDS